MKPFFKILCTASALALSACQSTADYVEKNPDHIGAPAILGVVGAVTGYTLGGGGAEAIASSAGLGVAGIVVGVLASHYLAKRDSRVMNPTFEKVLAGPTNKQMHWQNPHTGNSGTLTALSPLVEFLDKTCRWVRSEQRQAANTKPVFGIHIDYTAMFDREDLMLCDRGEGWYITWDEQVSGRLQDATSSRVTNLAHPVQTARHLTDN
ncbi:hypothetical protein N9452_08155 [Alphaproteobacteria bacterium]|nr:hypothetical protein [Alphaproteobacteria bacterium]